MGTKNNPGVHDCYAAALPDEPLFVLLGRDRHAPALVWLWAALRAMDEEDAAVVAEARACVVLMLKWAATHGQRRSPVGFAQATLAGLMELVRGCNAVHPVDSLVLGEPTDIDTARRFLSAMRHGPDSRPEVVVRADGTWLLFRASNGQSATLNLENLINELPETQADALLKWCADRRA